MLSILGEACILYKNEVLSREINRGAMLVPHGGDKALMLDRFDCRGYLQDLRTYKSNYDEVMISHEELEIEQSCDYERYYDLYHNNGLSNIQQDVSFDNTLSNKEPRSELIAAASGNSKDSDENSNNEVEYICPSSLILPAGMIMPSTEREAAIIEQTARFVTEEGSQLEILIKVKQGNNAQFQFLNSDHKLNPFYRHITNLIKSAQYIPPKRHISHILKYNIELSEDQIKSTHVLHQKLDISDTPYGKLIERFKQNQKKKSINKIDQVLQDVLKPSDKNKRNIIANNSSPESIEICESRQRMYHELYHQYFPYYFQHCKDIYGNLKPHDILTEMARDYAASFAIAWIQSNMLQTAIINQKQDEDDRIMKKMAEYVSKNGVELESIMYERNKERFGFLLPNHLNYEKYKKYLKQEIIMLHPGPVTEFEAPEQVIDCIIDSYGLHSPPHNINSGPISFKLVNNKIKRTSAIHIENSQSNDINEDFDFTDRLISKRKSLNGLFVSNKPRRISRFSPANPKNIEIIAEALNNDIQIHRKRKAEEFMTSISELDGE